MNAATEAHIAKLVAEAPPLSAAQRDRIATLVRPGIRPKAVARQ